MNDDFDLGSLEVTNGGLDAFLSENPGVVTPLGLAPRAAAERAATDCPKKVAAGRIRVASLDQLNGFIRTAEDMLVHKSNRDLWSLRKDGNGEFYVERMFDDAGAPLKG
jgi:hypothetical protein